MNALVNLAAAAGDDLVVKGAVGPLLKMLELELLLGTTLPRDAQSPLPAAAAMTKKGFQLATLFSNLACTAAGADAVTAAGGIEILGRAGEEGREALLNLADHVTDKRAPCLLDKAMTKATHPKRRRRI